MNAEELVDLLKARYAPEEYAFFTQFEHAGSLADAVAFRLWQSRGYTLFGFEIKVSRADWLVELKKPDKAEPIWRNVNQWFIVAPKGVVELHELPLSWGLLEASGGKLRMKKDAEYRQVSPEIGFIARLIDHSQRFRWKETHDEVVRQVMKWKADALKSSDAHAKDLAGRISKLCEERDAFMEKAGLGDEAAWIVFERDAGKYAAFVKSALFAGASIERAEVALRNLESACASFKAGLELMKKSELEGKEKEG